MTESTPIDEAMDHFIANTDKSTVAVVVPLYGYWNDIPDNPVNGEVLSIVLSRLYSNVHHLYFIFVAHPQSLPNDAKDPQSVSNILISKSQAGNCINVPVARSASYAEYVREGIDCALTETNARFVVVANPWVLIQEGGLDTLVERANRGDDARAISGTNVRTAIDPAGFDDYHSATGRETREIDLNFFAVVRNAAEMITFDEGYMTKGFFEMDIFQCIRQKGFESIASEFVPIFPFDFPWQENESEEMFEADQAYFIKKWGFSPGLTYGKATS